VAILSISSSSDMYGFHLGLQEVISPKSRDEGLSKEPGNSSGTNDCNVEGVKTSKQDPKKELPITTMEEEPKDEKGDETNKEEVEQNGNKDKLLRKTDKLLHCPRCDSSGTKFCYYNNYNVNQPRHFCKDCQRYWTVGGTMRNVPVGAGRRKNKHSGTHYWHTMKSVGLTPARTGASDAAHYSGYPQCTFFFCKCCMQGFHLVIVALFICLKYAFFIGSKVCLSLHSFFCSSQV
jgi:hypothetical protein